MSDTPVIAGAVRTPIGAFMGALSSVPATELGSLVIREALDRAGVAGDQVDDVLMGNILQAGLGQGPARQAAVGAGLPVDVPATTINMLCGSGLRAVGMAAQAIRAGDAGVVVAGGMENMSLAPHVAYVRQGQRLGDVAMRDTLIADGLWCALTDQHMGSTAERVAEQFGVSREEQDAFAAESQRLAGLALEREHFRDEIVAVPVPQRKGDPVLVDTDEHPRPGTTVDTLAGLRPAFEREGTVTAGNASGINDGAAAMVVLSEERAAELGVTPMARILGYAWSALDPAIMGMGPVKAVRAAMDRAGIAEVRDIELFEVNEAFAAQAVAVQRELGIGREVLNVNGGAIALGHPVGASGARILVTLLHELRHREARLGVAALCVGGGQGVAVVVESLG